MQDRETRDRPEEGVDEREQRWELLANLDALIDRPLIGLSLVWVLLMIVDLTRGLNPALQIVTYVIWGIFVLDALIEFTIAPDRRDYLRRNWLTVIALVVPAFRILRVLRALRLLRTAGAVRSVSLVRVITSTNRGMRAVRSVVGGHGLGYVVAITLVVTFGGAAGMYLFENPTSLRQAGVPSGGQTTPGLDSYADAVWWTAMVMTTMGSDYFPQTVEGRILGLAMAMYAFAIFGYVAATLASIFIKSAKPTERARGTDSDALAGEIRALRNQFAALADQLDRRLPEGRPGGARDRG